MHGFIKYHFAGMSQKLHGYDQKYSIVDLHPELILCKAGRPKFFLRQVLSKYPQWRTVCDQYVRPHRDFFPLLESIFLSIAKCHSTQPVGSGRAKNFKLTL